jgi:hypothetical protein
MELTGRIQATALSIGGKPLITFEVNEYKDALNASQDFKYDLVTIKVTKHKKKRSLDANALAWVLMDKIASKLRITKEEVYRNAIRNIGGVSETVCAKNEAVEKLCAGWRSNGIGWQTETMPSKIDGCTNVVLYYGSSCYDKEQMHRLLDNIIEDCRNLGIEIRSPEEIASLLGGWQ